MCPRCTTDARAVAARPRVPRGHLAGCRRPPDLPEDGGDVTRRPVAELHSRALRRRRDRRRHEGPPDGARERPLVPARGGGVPPPNAARPLSEWAILDSNQGPPPYQSGALTN